jgi:hypothetical protein
MKIYSESRLTQAEMFRKVCFLWMWNYMHRTTEVLQDYTLVLEWPYPWCFCDCTIPAFWPHVASHIYKWYSHYVRGLVLSHHITRYSHTLTQIHINPQNSCPLCKSANVDIAAKNNAETYWLDIPARRPLWH